jgi:hypothetical protein
MKMKWVKQILGNKVMMIVQTRLLRLKYIDYKLENEIRLLI